MLVFGALILSCNLFVGVINIVNIGKMKFFYVAKYNKKVHLLSFYLILVMSLFPIKEVLFSSSFYRKDFKCHESVLYKHHLGWYHLFLHRSI